jgi:hypothetical protein
MLKSISIRYLKGKKSMKLNLLALAITVLLTLTWSVFAVDEPVYEDPDWHPNGELLVYTRDSHTFIAHDLTTGESIELLTDSECELSEWEWYPTGDQAVYVRGCAGENAKTMIGRFDAETMQVSDVEEYFRPELGYVVEARFNSEGTMLATLACVIEDECGVSILFLDDYSSSAWDNFDVTPEAGR